MNAFREEAIAHHKVVEY